MTASRGLFPVLLLTLAPAARAGGEELELATELVQGGFDRPVQVCAPRGDAERLFVVEQSGTVRVISNGAVLAEPFLDVSDELTYFGENGLLGLAFHPRYYQNGHVFACYNDSAGDLRIARYTVIAPKADNVVNTLTEREVLVLPQPFVQHNGSSMAFGPKDGLLYLSTGDGGGGGDPFGNAQNLESLLGKILRIDVDQLPYSIPPDNPFVLVPDVRPEIWAYGLRNPWRTGFDTVTGDLFIGDVGAEMREEIDVIPGDSPGGENFGWQCAEGSLCTGTCGCPPAGVVEPVYEYDHNLGCAVMGGFVYRGAAVPALGGRYLFGDYCTSRVWSFVYSGGAATDLREHTTELSPPAADLALISSFGRDGRGEAYVVSHLSGDIWRIVPAPELADCDGDGTLDTDELSQGTAFDVNANGVPDGCESVLTVSDLVPGEIATVQYLGADPGALVYFFYSPRGIGPGPCLLDGALCLDLLPIGRGAAEMVPFLFGLPASAQGEATFGTPVPLEAQAVELAFQAVTIAGGVPVKSNAVLKVL